MKSAATREAMERQDKAKTALLARRQALREKLAREDEAYAQELAGKSTSREAKRAELEARARALLAKREEERLLAVEEMKYKRWCESNIEAREAASRSLAQKVEIERQAQVKERERLASEEQARRDRANAVISENWAKDAASARQLDIAARDGRNKLAQELRKQLRAREDERLARMKAEQEERARLKRQWEIEATTNNAALEEVVIRKRAMHMDLMESNAKRQLELLAALERERANDAKLLAEALQQERILDAEHAELAQRRREEDILFAKYLRQLSAERKTSLDMEDERIENERMAYEKREAETRKLAELARLELMQECTVTRARQIKEAEERRAAEEAEEAEWRKARDEDSERAREELEQKFKQARLTNVNHRLILEKQIRDKLVLARLALNADDTVDHTSTNNARYAERFAKEQNMYLF